jgi:hypothetical protein
MSDITDDLGIVIRDANGNEIATIYVGVGGIARAGTVTRTAAARLLAKLQAGFHARQLNSAMVAAGLIKPAGHAAHHIVASGAEAAAPARAILKKLGIGIDEAVNGVFLPRTVSAGTGAIHAGGHARTYYELVNRALRNVRTKDEAIAVLREIAEGLRNGTIGL